MRIYGSFEFPGASHYHWATTPDDGEEYYDVEAEQEPDYDDLESLDEAFQDHVEICASVDV